MGFIFKSTKNTRTIIEGSLRFIRSDVPTSVSEEERAWLVENKITAIMDLRTDAEMAKKECPLACDSRFTYYKRPVSGGDAIPEAPSEVARSYIAMVDEGLFETVELMLSLDFNVLFFCNAGKDRTGVLSAILLRRLGKDDEYIISDYMKSKENLSDMLAAFASKNPTVNIDVITPREEYIKDFLLWYDKHK